MRSHQAILSALLLVAAACSDSGHGRPAPPAPEAINVPPFAMGQPDAVLLVTGSTDGMMEVCNCSGPMPGGLARRSGLVISYRKAFPDRTVLIDTGDVFWIKPQDVRNRYVLKGYRQMGYDAVVLGDQEWAAPDAMLAEVMPPGETAWLSTTVASKQAEVPLARVVRRQLGNTKLAIVSDIRPDAFLFFDAARQDELDFMPRNALRQIMQQLKADRFAVVAVVHGSGEELEQAAGEMPADVILRGHSQQSAKELLAAAGKPVVKVGGSEHLAALALRISPSGEVTDTEYRLEVVGDTWPLDKRMLELYQAYAHEAMRIALDAKREKSFDMVPSAQCGQCHAYQYKMWKQSPHAHAYESLQRVGRTTDPNCVGCHTLGFGMEGGFYTVETTPKLAGVHCQNCHRVGYEEHVQSPAATPKVTDEVCTSCHTPVTDPTFNEKRKQRFHDLGCGPASE